MKSIGSLIAVAGAYVGTLWIVDLFAAEWFWPVALTWPAWVVVAVFFVLFMAAGFVVIVECVDELVSMIFGGGQ